MYRYLPNIIYLFDIYTLCIGRCGWSCLAFQLNSIQFPSPVNPTKSVASDQIRLGAGQMQMQPLPPLLPPRREREREKGK